jgi:hypothetical protein
MPHADEAFADEEIVATVYEALRKVALKKRRGMDTTVRWKVATAERCGGTPQRPRRCHEATPSLAMATVRLSLWLFD